MTIERPATARGGSHAANGADLRTGADVRTSADVRKSGDGRTGADALPSSTQFVDEPRHDTLPRQSQRDVAPQGSGYSAEAMARCPFVRASLTARQQSTGPH